MEKTMTLVLVLFLFTLLFTTCLSQETCHKGDLSTVLKIKKSLTNPNSLVSWDPTIFCSGVGNHVVILLIHGQPVSGQIPPEVGDLSYLETLVFRELSNLTGPIQPTIAKLKKLRTLRLTSTKLTGPVPDFLGQLKNLLEINLSHNELSGSIPSSLSLLPCVIILDLRHNKLTGSIPESFGSFPRRVPEIYLSHNQLSGSIPKSLGNLDFNGIDFSWNKLEGDASFLFGTKKTTRYINLSRNMLQFDISKVKIPKTLNTLYLEHNGITGNISVQWTEAPLRYFNVSYNKLCGPIPNGGKFQTYETDSSSYFHNKCLWGAPLKSCNLLVASE